MTPDDDASDSERETLSGRALAWVETLRRADGLRIAELERQVHALQRSEAEFARRHAVVIEYVRACHAIREAPYPSQIFAAAVARASAAYHALLSAFDPC